MKQDYSPTPPLTQGTTLPTSEEPRCPNRVEDDVCVQADQHLIKVEYGAGSCVSAKSHETGTDETPAMGFGDTR